MTATLKDIYVLAPMMLHMTVTDSMATFHNSLLPQIPLFYMDAPTKKDTKHNPTYMSL